MTNDFVIAQCLRKQTVMRSFICLINERQKMPQSACTCKKIRNIEHQNNEGSS